VPVELEGPGSVDSVFSAASIAVGDGRDCILSSFIT